ncbi:hypothetical protein [Pseudooceanicola sp. LIPI14-2-Ac024]|uniref:hypothetical protein n=1 Tax=Pseudooceanicola sp. LIPI14-2-Ac024 TaxID=3344875 RepID=UPI0035CEA049
MTTNTTALKSLIGELDRNLRLCDGVIAGAHWRLVEDISARRARAAATLRAVLRWYGETMPPRRTRPDADGATVGDLVAADADLIRAYNRACAVADADAPEARLVEEQRRIALRDRERLREQMAPVSSTASAGAAASVAR